MATDSHSLLIVEDDLDVAEMLTAYFRVQEYDVQSVNWGEDCLRACQNARPDLILLDIRLPDMDGYEVARRLRSSRRTQDIPIIFLTEKRQRADRLQGLELGADDYITKPFDVQELRLRVRNALQRHAKGSLDNPVTKLPERTLVDERLRECLHESDWAMLVVRLENLDRFREDYGFVASDDVLRAISLMIQNAAQDAGGPEDFLGHLEDTTFVLITRPEYLEEVAARLQTRLDQTLDYFYPLKDREAGVPVDARLRIHQGTLQAGQASPDDLDGLKTALLRQAL